MKRLFLLLLSGLFMPLAQAQKQTITVASELKSLIDIESLPRYVPNTAIKQTSSYDTTGGNDDGFSGKYSFVRKNADSSLVIFEAKGSGTINRIWTPTPNTDTLDFYFSGSSKPSYSIAFTDLFSGKVYPFIAPLTGNEIGGYFSYVPIPFSNGCKIVSRGREMQFYQIQYRSYPKGSKVENFSPELTGEARQALETLAARWKNFQPASSKMLSTDALLKPGESIVLADIKTGGRINGIRIHSAKSFTGLSKQVDIRISYDQEPAPAVYLPVADYFGYAFGNVSMQSLLHGTANDINYSYLPMPFDQSAKVELIYRTPPAGVQAEPIRIQAEVLVGDQKRDPKTEGKFYVNWNKSIDPPRGVEHPHTFLKGKGRGHYVGTIMQTQGLEPGMTLFFEGDDVSIIDGEMRVHGTGSEDYFNGGWYALLNRWDRGISLPLHGSLDYSLPFARTGGYRLFISDKMPFEKEIIHTMEHGPENNDKRVDYTSVAMYYAEKPVTAQANNPENALTQVYMPDTLMVYPQLMRFTMGEGSVEIDGETFTSYNGAHLRIALDEIPKGRYKMYADLEHSPVGAEITVWQRQKQTGKPYSFYAEKDTRKHHEFLSDIVIDDFTDNVTFRYKREENRHRIKILRLILVRQ
jgi:hypothetical protein